MLQRLLLVLLLIIGIGILIFRFSDSGAEIARREMFIKGSVPLHTLRHFIDFSKQTAFTTYGTIGVKVWVFRKGIQDGGGETPPNKK